MPSDPAVPKMERLTIAKARNLKLYDTVMSPSAEKWVVIFDTGVTFIIISEDQKRRRHIKAEGFVHGGWFHAV